MANFLSDQNRSQRHWIFTSCAAALLLIHAALLGWISYVSSPNLDEPAHLASGISHWKFGRFELYRVNPPLVRMVAAAPVLFTDAKTDWSAMSHSTVTSRNEFAVGTQFVVLNGLRGFWYFALARWACIPLCLLGLWAVYAWASELYGPAAGLTAMWLYCFCPNCLTWGATITPDGVATSLGVFAAYWFWKWLNDPTWNRAFVASLAFGAALLTKGTFVLVFVLYPILWFLYRFVAIRKADSLASTTSRPSVAQLALVLLFPIYMLNMAYGFEGSFQRLGDYKFISRTLGGHDRPAQGANRFEGSWLGQIPVPLPENYVRGLDVQKSDFERGRWSYLFGEQKKGGWWYYYMVAFLLKTPVGTLTLIAVASILPLIVRRFASTRFNEVALLLLPLVIFAVVSSQTGMSRYLRYALPVVPFAYIHASRIAAGVGQHGRLLPALIIACCVGTAVESLALFPYSLSFFNRIAGGPLKGPDYLLDANIDWGQDLLHLKRWYDQNPQARPFHLAYFGHMDVNPEAAEIAYQPVCGFLAPDQQRDQADGKLQGPQPGWFAVSINHIKGYHHYEFDRPMYTFFQRLKPVAMAGYSIYIYHITPEEASRLRAELQADESASPSGPAG